MIRSTFLPPAVNASLSRRVWLRSAATQTGVLLALTSRAMPDRRGFARSSHQVAHAKWTSECWAPEQLEQWAQQAVEAACAAGASYADARLTRTVQQSQGFIGGELSEEVELVGAGVRALVNGYWGFAACPLWVSGPNGADLMVRLARTATTQAKGNARGTPRTVEMGSVTPVTGTWTTPIAIDPFSISLEEKQDAIRYWVDLAPRFGLVLKGPAWFRFIRQERVMATSDGSHTRQTCYQSGGAMAMLLNGAEDLEYANKLPLVGLEMAGKGWEMFQEANIPEQMALMPDKLKARSALDRHAYPSNIGRYTVVCDGATMASLLQHTLGVATQLDRALGYEANAGGTSYLDDPLAMLGQLQVASPFVTVTANRSTPTQLGTVQWDDEGVVPKPFTLVKDGVLTDFQTTREQAAWLAPYYQRQGRPVRSHGCAAAQDASYITMQHMPNLTLSPNTAAVLLEHLVKDVDDGLLLEGGVVQQGDFQGRMVMLQASGFGLMREIKNGRLGREVTGGTVLLDAMDLWKRVAAIGGSATEMGTTMSQEDNNFSMYLNRLKFGNLGMQLSNLYKGQPSQSTDHSVRAVAATITNQPLVHA